MADAPAPLPPPARNSLLVFSGKGGVGKTTVAVNLALGLALEGRRVGLLDTDIHGPNVARMLGIEGQRLTPAGTDRVAPVRGPAGLAVVSMSFLLDRPEVPVVWRGPLKMGAIQQFIQQTDWGELDWLVIDSPPGTGDEPLSVAQLLPGSLALVVTTPQQVALGDARRAIEFAALLKLRVVGVVENMSRFACPHCGQPVDLFPAGGGERLAREAGAPWLGSIPLDPAIAAGGDSGNPFIARHDGSPAATALRAVIARLIEVEAKPA